MYPWCNKIALTAEHVAEYLSRRCGGSKMDKCKDGGTFSYLFSIFIYDISGTFCPHTLGVCELWCPPFNESMKFGILTQFWGLGHFLCSHRYDRGNLAFKRFYSTLHSPPLWTSRRLFFCFCFCICICDVPGILSCSQLKSSRDDWFTCGRADYSVLKSKACWCHLKCLSPTVSSLAH